MTQGTPRDVVTDTSRMERVQQSGAIARLGWPQDTSTDWEGDIPKDQDKVRDCRERCSSWTGLDDLRGRQPPSPFLYVHFVPERVKIMGLYSLPQHTLSALEPPPLNLGAHCQPKYPPLSHPIHFVNAVALGCSHPQSSPGMRSDLFKGASTKEGSQCKSCVQLARGDHSNIPARQKHRVEWTHPGGSACFTESREGKRGNSGT